MLSRLHDLLGSSVDEMLLANRVAKGLAEHDPDAMDDIDAAVHARTLLAVNRDGVGVDVLLAATGCALPVRCDLVDPIMLTNCHVHSLPKKETTHLLRIGGWEACSDQRICCWSDRSVSGR
ncbi:hypothetical protein [Nocardia fluminea]|uniref:hypothetical protein n=1 Tax=Nocardia fluminea TaxID=134984 RepID=UPI003443913E